MPASLPHASVGGWRRPNLSLLADRCATLRVLTLLHSTMLVSGRLTSDAFVASFLLAAYVALSPPANVLYLLSSLPCIPNSYMLNTSLYALASSPDLASAIPFFPLLLHRRDSSFSADTPSPSFPSSFATVIAPSQQAHIPLPPQGPPPAPYFQAAPCVATTAYVTNGLVRAYPVVGLVRVTCKVFDEFPERNTVYTTMVSVYA